MQPRRAAASSASCCCRLAVRLFSLFGNWPFGNGMGSESTAFGLRRAPPNRGCESGRPRGMAMPDGNATLNPSARDGPVRREFGACSAAAGVQTPNAMRSKPPPQSQGIQFEAVASMTESRSSSASASTEGTETGVLAELFDNSPVPLVVTSLIRDRILAVNRRSEEVFDMRRHRRGRRIRHGVLFRSGRSAGHPERHTRDRPADEPPVATPAPGRIDRVRALQLPPHRVGRGARHSWRLRGLDGATGSRAGAGGERTPARRTEPRAHVAHRAVGVRRRSHSTIA